MRDNYAKSGEPYFNHCVATAINIANQKWTPTLLLRGLMHDLLEDTKYTAEQMEKDFGPTIMNLVEGSYKTRKS